MELGRAVVVAGAVGDSDGRHQRDASRPRTQGAQDVAHAAVVHALHRRFAATVGAVREDDGVDTVHRVTSPESAELTIGTGAVGPVTARLRTHLTGILRGELPDPHDWFVTAE